MSKPTKDEAGRVIVDIIRNRPAGIASGPHVGAVLKYKLDGFQPIDYGVPTLKSFIQKFVPEVLVTVNSPTEVSYSLNPSMKPNTVTTPDSNPAPNETAPDTTNGSVDRPEERGSSNTWLPPNIWFAIVGAGGKNRLSIQQKTGQTRLDSFDTPVPEGWVRIEPMSDEDHQAIARQFSEDVPEAHRGRIDPLIGSGPTWWKDHFAALSELGFAKSYRRFHSARVLHKFETIVKDKLGMRLKSLRLPDGNLVSEYVSPIRWPSTSQRDRQRAAGGPINEDLLRSLAELSPHLLRAPG